MSEKMHAKSPKNFWKPSRTCKKGQLRSHDIIGKSTGTCVVRSCYTGYTKMPKILTLKT